MSLDQLADFKGFGYVLLIKTGLVCDQDRAGTWSRPGSYVIKTGLVHSQDWARMRLRRGWYANKTGQVLKYNVLVIWYLLSLPFTLAGWLAVPQHLFWLRDLLLFVVLLSVALLLLCFFCIQSSIRVGNDSSIFVSLPLCNIKCVVGLSGLLWVLAGLSFVLFVLLHFSIGEGCRFSCVALLAHGKFGSQVAGGKVSPAL